MNVLKDIHFLQSESARERESKKEGERTTHKKINKVDKTKPHLLNSLNPLSLKYNPFRYELDGNIFLRGRVLSCVHQPELAFSNDNLQLERLKSHWTFNVVVRRQ
jgi:hypothetical protein